jgi:hypothetical protein
MIDALQKAVEQMEQLEPELQELFAERIKQMLLELDVTTRNQEAIARQDAEWSARLPEQLARIARGEHGTIYHSEEELDTALDAIPYEGEA